jgi:CDP-paratose 2-epimerase
MSSGPVVVFGGAGFVGTNLVSRLAERGARVRVFDNLSRAGVERNAAWLTHTYRDEIELVEADVRDAAAVERAVSDAVAVFHLAAQVAVTTSLTDPRLDFDINLQGTFNVLEALRGRKDPPPLLFTSTNKVYGDLGGVELVERSLRYEPSDPTLASAGVRESQTLSFHSPYGCSKGAADQYVLDYARVYSLPAVVFRMSCIYGPHQFGTEDQGWIAHFLIRAIEGRPLSIYGDGKQVRDALYVDDLVDAMLITRTHAARLSGRAFNIGGTPRRSVSLLELLAMIARLRGVEPTVEYGPWRPGDQRWYASDVSRFSSATGWHPRTEVAEGVRRLHAWLGRARDRVASPRAEEANEDQTEITRPM